jgi:hypothetical protein
LFELTDLLRRSGDDTVVVLEQRGGLEPIALVREARLAYLEARAMHADKEQTVPFKLAGSLSSALAPAELEETLRQIRKDWVAAKPRPARPAAKKPRRNP